MNLKQIVLSTTAISLFCHAQDIEYWKNQGIQFDAPQSVILEEGIYIGRGTKIGAGVHILNGSHVGKNCHIKAYAIVDQSKIGDGSTIGYYAVVERAQLQDKALIHSHTVIEDGSTVESQASVGPYARIRKGSVIAQQAEVGNFVELSDSTIGPKSKAKHLTYLGCTIVEEAVNIGAGTITCNYDGFKRHNTVFGKGSFIGSNSTFVAPVHVGAKSIVGAGSVCTKNVPENALAIARSHQTNKEQYATTLREKFKNR